MDIYYITLKARCTLTKSWFQFLMSSGLKTAYFTLRQKRSPESLLEPLGLPLLFKSCPPVTERRLYYDTFEWQAFQNKCAVVYTRNRLCLVDLDNGEEIACTDITDLPVHFFPSLLEPGKVRSLLSDCSGLRALSLKCALDSRIRAIRVLDTNEKTIGYLHEETISLANSGKKQSIDTWISFRSVRGYQRELNRLVEKLAERKEFRKQLEFSDLYQLVMRQSGCTVNDYSSKISLSLDPDASIHESMRKLLAFTLKIMKKNEQGIMEDIDTEFLHDYRVALRRTRSLLSQLKGVFDPAVRIKYQRVFKELGKRTNRLRDMDVYLLKTETYNNLLPPSLRQPLSGFFHELESVRETEQKAYSKYLRSVEYKRHIAGWNAFLGSQAQPDSTIAPAASDSTMSIAVKVIRKAWKRVIANGRDKGEHPTAEELHSLRIDCKKLRYLLEFFSSLFPHHEASSAIRHLKALQEHLGLVVDLSIQRQYLGDRLTSLSESNGSAQLAAALGGLIATLYLQEEEIRINFHEAFNRFDSDETHALFSGLLNSDN
jgi:CHAD domain-containing protein